MCPENADAAHGRIEDNLHLDWRDATIATYHSLNSVSIFFFSLSLSDTAIWRKHPKWIALQNAGDRSGENVNEILVLAEVSFDFPMDAE